MVRTPKTILALLLVMLLTVALAGTVAAQDASSVDLYDVQGRVVGNAAFTSMDDGETQIVIQVNGMNPVAGDRRIAISGVGSCDATDTFSSAGEDLQELPDIQFYATGSASYKFVVDDVDVDSFADADGSALVIYADKGEDAGDRIICGVISAASETGTTPATAVPATPAPAETPATDTPATPEAPAAPEEASDLIEDWTLEGALNDGYGVLLRDVQGRDVGLGLMIEDPFGDSSLILSLGGMQAVGGDHRVAVTSTDVCEGDFSSAGDEVAVLPNVQFYGDGSADYSEMTDDLALDSLADADGSSVVIYADKGDDSDRIICGSVISAADTLEYYGITVEEFAAFVEFLAS